MNITIIEHDYEFRPAVGISIGAPFKEKVITKDQLIEYIEALDDEKVVRISVHPNSSSS